jgi:hypothetical protein
LMAPHLLDADYDLIADKHALAHATGQNQQGNPTKPVPRLMQKISALRPVTDHRYSSGAARPTWTPTS